MADNIFLTTDPEAVVIETLPDDISFGEFYERYLLETEGRQKPTTRARREAMVRDKILPAFADVPLREITPWCIRGWQNSLIRQGYRPTYLKTIDMQLYSVLKYAAKYYDYENPYDKVSHMGSGKADAMHFWSLEEYRRFIRACDGQPMVYLAFEILYWTGMRVGEMLALTPGDIDPNKRLLSITKTYVRHDHQDMISPPKTPGSIRTVAMPVFLCQEITEYIQENGIRPQERIIPRTSDFIKHHLRQGCERSGVPRIRIHDIRHSHVSLLVDQGFTAAAIAERVGHKHISTTMNVYAHLFNSRQEKLIEALEQMHAGTYVWADSRMQGC